MKNVLIWDIPIRIFHFGFALCCPGALAIGLLADDESAIFPYHMLLGIAAGFFLVVRLVLGVMGSEHNRLKTLLFSPAETVRYVLGALGGQVVRYPVHNPGTSAVALGMGGLVIFLILTGSNMSEEIKEVHGYFAYGLLALICFHLAGLVLHAVKCGEHVWLSMATGTKPAPPEMALRSAHPITAVVVLLCSVAWIGGLFANYNPGTKTVTLPLMGKTLALGEKEGAEGNKGAKEHDGGKGKKDRDDD